jgi:uncharacterized integral membrane protein
MWAIRAILICLVVICMVAFAYYNVKPDQKVNLDLVYFNYVNVPVVEVVFWSFVAGTLVSLLISISMYMRMSMEGRVFRRRIKALEHEVTILRNRPIDESAAFIKGKDGAPPEILPTPDAGE